MTEEWIYSGRPPVAERSKWAQVFCLHRETKGQPTRQHFYFKDTFLVQCERCSFWHVPKHDSRSGDLLRHMFTGRMRR